VKSKSTTNVSADRAERLSNLAPICVKQEEQSVWKKGVVIEIAIEKYINDKY
jgi:hypothetical protein